MKLFFDENLSYQLVDRLAALFPGSRHIDQAGLRGNADTVIWDYARTHDLCIVSKDNDFRQLSVLRGPPPKIVWLSVGNTGTDVIAGLLQQNANRITGFGGMLEENLLILELAFD